MKMSPRDEVKPENYQINAKICRLVEKFPCMYDRSHPHYLKKDVVDKAWVKISKEMDDSIPSCKERWRNIRTSFARSINVNKIPASANRTKPYYLHEELKFLARHITPGIPIPRRSNAYSSAGEESEIIEVSVGEDTFDGFALAHEDDSQDEAEPEDEDEEEGPQSSVDDERSNALKKEKLEAAEPEQTASVAADSMTASTTPICPPKKRRRTGELENEASPEGTEQKYTPPSADADFDMAFLQGLLPEMKAMDFRQKILFKRRIYEVIGEIFESNAAIPTTTTPASSTQSQLGSSPTKIMQQGIPLTPNTTYAAGVVPTMTVVNAADLAMIRRLNSLLQSPSNSIGGSALSAMVAAPKSVCASISSTLRTAAPSSTATVAVNRGALTRSSANLMRVTMVNPPSTGTTTLAPLHVVKQEPETVDD